MSRTAVADFVGRYVRNPKSGIPEEPESGRVVMSKQQLVIADDDNRTTIPLSDVVDVVVGNVPPALRSMFDDTITVGYESDGESVKTVLIEGKNETIQRFTGVLFKCLLNGTEGITKHPARVGGRVTDTPVKPAKLSIESEQVDIRTPDGSFEIDITAVVDFNRTRRSPDGTERPTLLVKHSDCGEIVTSLLAPATSREVNLLGRYLRIEYTKIRSEIADVELTDSEKQILVTIYATGGDIDFTRVLDGNAAQATNVLNALREKGLLEEGSDGLLLTSEGQIIVSDRLEDVNR